MQIVRIILVGLLALMFVGCASRSEIETMKEQLNYLYANAERTDENLNRLDSLYKLTIEKNVGYQADLKAQLQEMLDRMGSIEGRLTDIETRLNERIDRGQARQTQPVTPSDTQGIPPPNNATIDQNKMFDNAFTDLKAGNYDLAIMQFEEFIRQFPNTARTDDAQYWLAEAFYGKRDYAKAIPEFEKVDKNYKDSDKRGPALFKLARSYEETGNNARACSIFKRITTEMPDSFESRQAGEKLKDLQCP